MRVLIGTDGSDDAIAAAGHGFSLLAAPDIVTVVSVSESSVMETAGMESGFGGGIAGPDEIQAEQDARDAASRDAIDRTVAAISTTATVEERVEVGDAGHVLCLLAEELEADVVIVGSRGRGAIRRALMGSVSSHVVHNAPCPVLVIRLK